MSEPERGRKATVAEEPKKGSRRDRRHDKESESTAKGATQRGRSGGQGEESPRDDERRSGDDRSGRGRQPAKEIKPIEASQCCTCKHSFKAKHMRQCEVPGCDHYVCVNCADEEEWHFCGCRHDGFDIDKFESTGRSSTHPDRSRSPRRSRDAPEQMKADIRGHAYQTQDEYKWHRCSGCKVHGREERLFVCSGLRYSSGAKSAVQCEASNIDVKLLGWPVSTACPLLTCFSCGLVVKYKSDKWPGYAAEGVRMYCFQCTRKCARSWVRNVQVPLQERACSEPAWSRHTGMAYGGERCAIDDIELMQAPPAAAIAHRGGPGKGPYVYTEGTSEEGSESEIEGQSRIPEWHKGSNPGKSRMKPLPRAQPTAGEQVRKALVDACRDAGDKLASHGLPGCGQEPLPGVFKRAALVGKAAVDERNRGRQPWPDTKVLQPQRPQSEPAVLPPWKAKRQQPQQQSALAAAPVTPPRSIPSSSAAGSAAQNDKEPRAVQAVRVDPSTGKPFKKRGGTKEKEKNQALYGSDKAPQACWNCGQAHLVRQCELSCAVCGLSCHHERASRPQGKELLCYRCKAPCLPASEGGADLPPKPGPQWQLKDGTWARVAGSKGGKGWNKGKAKDRSPNRNDRFEHYVAEKDAEFARRRASPSRSRSPTVSRENLARPVSSDTGLGVNDAGADEVVKDEREG